MSAAQSCLVPWKACKIPVPRGHDNAVQPCKLEFTVIGPNGDEDRPHGASSYVLPGAGGYKLAHGTLRPFPQACQAPIMLVRAMHVLLPFSALSLALHLELFSVLSARDSCSIRQYHAGV